MKKLKKFAAIALVAAGIGAGVASTANAYQTYYGTYCLSLASGPAIGSCVTSTYGHNCDHSTLAGSQCAGWREVYDYVGL